jgi:DNA-binding transcriptional MerR regulator
MPKRQDETEVRPTNSSMSTEGTHTIRVVAERTGLEMGTLRAWERRYGFPRPQRRAGSNRRLYSDADVMRLIAVQRTLEQGYRVGDVIAKGVDELEDLARGLKGRSPASGAAAFAPTLPDELLDLLAHEQLSELEIRLRSSAASLGPRRFVTDLAHPFAVNVGQAWADGRLSIRHEHLATECLVTQIRQMLASYQDLRGSPSVLLATFPGEPHTLPLQLIALYLVVAGAKPRLLGGSTPAREIAECARMLDVDAVGVAITLSSEGNQVAKDVVTLRLGLDSRVPLWLGGSGARNLDGRHEGTRVLTSWDAIDRAVVECREHLPRGSSR